MFLVFVIWKVSQIVVSRSSYKIYFTQNLHCIVPTIRLYCTKSLIKDERNGGLVEMVCLEYIFILTPNQQVFQSKYTNSKVLCVLR